jgi:hypothetical protein
MGDDRNPNADTGPDGGPTETNISTEHQPKGGARNPSDTLDREGEAVAPGQRMGNDDSAVKPGSAG